jgi:hypothetical protein
MPDELVVHEPRPVHRLHHATHPLVVHRNPPGQPIQAIAIRRRGKVIDQLSLIGDQAYVNALATQIQPNV